MTDVLEFERINKKKSFLSWLQSAYPKWFHYICCHFYSEHYIHILSFLFSILNDMIWWVERNRAEQRRKRRSKKKQPKSQNLCWFISVFLQLHTSDRRNRNITHNQTHTIKESIWKTTDIFYYIMVSWTVRYVCIMYVCVCTLRRVQ